MKIFTTRFVFLLLPLLVFCFGGIVSGADAQQHYGGYNRSRFASSTEGFAANPVDISHWRQNSAVQSDIAALGTTAVASLPIPVLFGVVRSDLTMNFGDPRANGRTHEGLDILAPLDTPIVSPTNAVVIKVGFGDSAGNYVYTANPGNETYAYMHLDIPSTLKVGDKLIPGSFIGYVGNTGDAAGGVTHLHFEVRPGNVATDPYPRLTGEFTPQQKISFLTTILSVNPNPDALASTLILNFASTFNADKALGIILPTLIDTKLVNAPVGGVSANGDLSVGAKGAEVINLQKYLISINKGPAALALAAAGATGNFGALTFAALIEFQNSADILPANGVYTTATKSYVAAHPANFSGTPIPPAASGVPVIITSAPGSFNTDLEFGMTTNDVILLQRYLNLHGFSVASTGAGSYGNETNYFGPATRAAVIRLQLANSITPAVGYFGPITRAYVNSH